MHTVVVMNGEVVPLESATVSVFDRGFLYGDSVYEVIRTYRGIAFELEAHLERLAGSAARIGMTLPVPLATLADDVRRAQQAADDDDLYVRIVVTRGAGQIGLDTSLAENPRRVIIAMPVSPPPPSVYDDGVTVALVSVRKNIRTAIDPQAKTGNYLNSVMALAEARERGAFEAILLDHRDHITEGSSSNVFMVIEHALLTPPLDVGILKGVTRTVVFEVARRAGLRVLELPLSEAALKQADEVFITSSIREIVPVVRVDDSVIGTGRPGEVTRRLRGLFDAYVEGYVRDHRT